MLAPESVTSPQRIREKFIVIPMLKNTGSSGCAGMTMFYVIK